MAIISQVNILIHFLVFVRTNFNDQFRIVLHFDFRMIHRNRFAVNKGLWHLLCSVHEVIQYCRRHVVQKRIVSQHLFDRIYVRLPLSPSDARSVFAERTRQWMELAVSIAEGLLLETFAATTLKMSL